MTATIDQLVELPAGYRVDPDTGAWVTIPWPEGPDAGDERFALAMRSIGPQVIAWAEENLIHHLTGEPWRFTRGQKRWFVRKYEVTPAGRWVWRSSVKRGAKGTGKDPMAAVWLLCELLGPTLFSHFDLAGRPVGVEHRMPLVQIASNSEAQSKDVLRVANAMIPKALKVELGIDTGETRTTINGGGRMEVLTASERSSEGDPATAIALNESHHMTEASGGHRLAAVARRNVGKSPAWLQARLAEFTNAHRMGDDSVAEQSYAAWQAQVAGLTKRVDILYDSIEAPADVDLWDDESRARGLAAAYSDADWADLDRLDGEAQDARTTPGDTIRFYMNGLGAAADAWCDPARFDVLKRDLVLDERERIALFLDCSKSSDATGLVGCRISDGHVITLGCWQPPRGGGKRGRVQAGSMDKAATWLVPRDEVDAAVEEAFTRYRVVWFGVDPSPAKDGDTEALYWAESIQRWHVRYRKKVVVWATGGEKTGNAVLFDMRLSSPGGLNRLRQFTTTAMETVQAIDEDGTLTHDGHPLLRKHVHNARERPNQFGTSLGKATRDSSNLVDLAVCMVGARLGRNIALASGKVRKRRPSPQVLVG